LELQDFDQSIRSGISCGPTLDDAKAALQVVEAIYRTV
jgi:hypothetical protein